MEKTLPPSPHVESVGWGKLNVEIIGPGKDFKVWPGGGRPWDWQETGTCHSPGIQIADVEELVERGCQVVVLTRGVFSRLKVTPETVAFLKKNNIETVITDTKRGIKIYNDYIERNVPVGGLFHSTC